MSDLGGVQNSFLILGLFLTAIFSDRLFNSAIIGSIYQVDKAKWDNPSKPNYEIFNEPNKGIREDGTSDGGGLSGKLRQQMKKQFMASGVSKFLDASMKDTKQITKEKQNNLLTSIINRTVFKYSTK